MKEPGFCKNVDSDTYKRLNEFNLLSCISVTYFLWNTHNLIWSPSRAVTLCLQSQFLYPKSACCIHCQILPIIQKRLNLLPQAHVTIGLVLWHSSSQCSPSPTTPFAPWLSEIWTDGVPRLWYQTLPLTTSASLWPIDWPLPVELDSGVKWGASHLLHKMWFN